MVTEILNTCSDCGRQFGRLWKENICPSCKLKKVAKERQANIDLSKMKERIPKRKVSAERKRKFFIENLSRQKFCEMLDALPSMFRFELRNIREDFDGYWQKAILDGKTAWQKGERVLLSQFLFPFKREVCDAIDREIGVYYKNRRGWQAIRKILFNDKTVQILKKKKGEITLSLTKETLNTLYFKQKKSLEDISKEYGCTRPTIMNIMKKYGLERRTKSTARIEAIRERKFERFDYHEIDENFFSKWSPEMAWVLGLLFTDGTIDSTRVAIHSVDIDLLEKIKKLLNSSYPIQRRTQSYDKSKHIYEFGFYREKMREDLFKLGLHERKSLTIVFPDIPPEYMRHFIRGCWDGDGSVYISGGKIGANYVSGSLGFIKRLTEELYNVGIFNKSRPYHYEIDRNDKRIYRKVQEENIEKYEYRKYPLTIHGEKRSKAYYIRLASRENIEKLFHYFYDGIDESMYLSRKYNVFVEGFKLQEKKRPDN
jgi:DNA-directed RNA polymerase subunit RPC12/RpoP